MRSLVVAIVASLLGVAAPSRTMLGATPCAAQPTPEPTRRANEQEPALPDAGASLANEADEEGDPSSPDAPLVDAAPPPPDLLAGMTISSSPDRIADLVVIVSIDGLRADAVLTSHPAMNALAEQGVIATRALTIGRSTTLASHASMLSGVDDDKHGITWNSWRPNRPGVLFPTALRIAARAGLDAALFVTKSKLQHLLGPWPDGVALTQTRGSCTAVVRRADPWLRGTRAGVALLHFPEPDSAGHRRGWMSQAYRTAVDDVDRCLGDVVGAIAARPRGTDRVLLIVTADHGGHGRSHGTLLDVDRHIPWIAWGGAAQRGARVDRPVSTMDTAATTLEALGLPRIDGMRGQVVREALATTAPRDRRTPSRHGARRTREAERPPPRAPDAATRHAERAEIGTQRGRDGGRGTIELERDSLDALADELRALDARTPSARAASTPSAARPPSANPPTANVPTANVPTANAPAASETAASETAAGAVTGNQP
jgi:hypothetical protein